jgi:hypothetical protein
MKEKVKYYNVVTMFTVRVMLGEESMSIPEQDDTSRKCASDQYLIII